MAAAVDLSASAPDGTISEISLAAEEDKPGRFVGRLLAQTPGEHRLQLMLPDGAVIERRFTVTAPDLEFEEVRVDLPLLTSLAEKTGGQVVSIDRIDEIPAQLNDASETIVSNSTPRALWDRAWVILIVIALLSAEWLIRKLHHLA